MTKLTVTVVEWKPLRKGTLTGFVAIHIAEMRLTIRDINRAISAGFVDIADEEGAP